MSPVRRPPPPPEIPEGAHPLAASVPPELRRLEVEDWLDDLDRPHADLRCWPPMSLEAFLSSLGLDAYYHWRRARIDWLASHGIDDWHSDEARLLIPERRRPVFRDPEKAEAAYRRHPDSAEHDRAERGEP